MHHVGHDVIQQALVVRDDHRGILGRMEFRNARGDDAKGVDVESRVGLVEDRQFRVEHRHLENLVLLLLTAREAFVHGTRSELRIELHDSALLAHQAQELGGRQRLLAAELALFVHGQLHEIGHRDARYLDRVLEAEEQAEARPVFDRHVQQILPQERRRTFGDGELFIAREHRRERRLARTVGAHDGMHLAGSDLEVDAPQDLLAVDGRMQIFYA